MRNFCFLLADKERLAFLSEIAAWYGKLLDEAKGIIRGQCITAVQLSADKKSKLKDTLQQKAGTDIELTFAVDKDILGEFVVPPLAHGTQLRRPYGAVSVLPGPASSQVVWRWG